MLRPLSLTNNRLRGRRLEKEIRRGGWVHYPTSGHFKKHREEGFTIEGIPAAAARRLGRKFKQYAVVYIDKKGVQFLPCFNKRKKPAKTLRS